jgi:ribosomal protein L29
LFFARPIPPATGQQPKPDQFSKVRRNIARLKTVLREKRGNSK